MGQDVTLTSSDGFKLGAYRADPKGAPKGAVVVIQEIFGANHHIRAVTDRLASDGYVAVAPALFDRMQVWFREHAPAMKTEVVEWREPFADDVELAQTIGAKGDAAILGVGS